jgi:putative oxidoreductase
MVGGATAFREPGSRVLKAAELGIPSPQLAVRANGAVMVAAGVGLALGAAPRACATVLAGSLVPTTMAGHAFWREDTPEGRASHRIQFLKTLGLIGGLLAIAAEAATPHGEDRHDRRGARLQTLKRICRTSPSRTT